MEPRERFLAAWRSVGAPDASADAAFDAVVARYAVPERAYHNLSHIIATLDLLDTVREQLDHPAEAALALWFHDAVYDPRRADNEEASASLARQVLGDAGVGSDVVARIMAMIMDTRHDAPASSSDGAFVADADLATLGADDDTFDRYDAAIRQEYTFVPETAYRPARKALLERFLARESIYQTEPFRQRFEAAARGNIARVWGAGS
jgi:predicted metal-dependent HD superfamily phosphohydrolase